MLAWRLLTLRHCLETGGIRSQPPLAEDEIDIPEGLLSESLR